MRLIYFIFIYSNTWTNSESSKKTGGLWCANYIRLVVHKDKQTNKTHRLTKTKQKDSFADVGVQLRGR